MSYKISIIIPVYNVEDYLRNTLNSIVSQSIGFENLEVILVDDKSTDNSADIIKEYVNKYSNFKGIYFDEGSGYPGKPRNVGLKYATADYIMYLDSDDWFEENACEILYNTIIEEQADIVCGSFTKIHDDGTRKINYSGWVSTLTSPNESGNRWKKAIEMVDDPNFKLVVTDLNENPTILGNANVWAKIYRKDLITDNEITFPEDIVAQDSVFLLESFLDANKIVFINDIIVNYNNQRIEDGNRSISYVKTNKNLYGRIKAYDLMNNISKKFSKEKLYYEYLLGSKLQYWVGYYLLESDISTFEIRSIFKKYSYLFSNCYEVNKKLPKNIRNVFKEIYNENYNRAASMISKLQSESSPKSDNPIKVSVIVPVYNNERFLKKCLDSIINQTLKEIEIICVDDGSSDNSLKILNEYKSKDGRFEIISQKNLGAATARNNGLKVANGDFIAFVDSDDWLELNALEKLYNNATSNGSDLVLFNSVEHHPDNSLKERIYIKNDSIKNHDYFTFDYQYKKHLVLNGYQVIWSKLYKTSFLKENNITFSNHLIFNDVQFHVKTMLTAKKISYCPDILYNYLRVNQNSLQNNVGLTKKSFVILDIIDEIENYLIENDFYDGLKSNFNRYKITQLQIRLEKIDYEYKDEFFQLLKSNFKKMSLSEYQIKKLPSKHFRFFMDVLNYDSYYEYCYYQENKISPENINPILQKLLTNKNKLILDLNKKIQLLKKQTDSPKTSDFNSKQEDYLKSYIASMELLINGYQNSNKQLNDDLKRSENENDALNEDLEKIKKTCAQYEKNIESLTQINNEFGILQEDFNDLSKENKEQRKMIDDLLNEKNDLNSEIEKLLDENNKLKSMENDLKTSNSWKVTKPFRKINNLR